MDQKILQTIQEIRGNLYIVIVGTVFRLINGITNTVTGIQKCMGKKF